MSVEALTWAKKVRLPEPPKDAHTSRLSAKAILMSLADYADADGIAYPSVTTIADETEQSQRAAQYALKWLESVGLIERQPRFRTPNGRQTSNVYVLPMRGAPGASPPVQPGAPPPVQPPAPHEPPEGVSPPSDEGGGARPPKSRKPDPIFDELATMENMNPYQLPKGAGSRVRKVQVEIAGHTPGITVEELRRRRANWPLLFRGRDEATFSIEAFAKWWPRLDDPDGSRARRARDEQRRRQEAEEAALAPPGMPFSEFVEHERQWLEEHGKRLPVGTKPGVILRFAARKRKELGEEIRERAS